MLSTMVPVTVNFCVLSYFMTEMSVFESHYYNPSSYMTTQIQNDTKIIITNCYTKIYHTMKLIMLNFMIRIFIKITKVENK